MSLSKLSRECINNKGLCCENRINLVLDSGSIVGSCPHFKEPYCLIYKKRPLDCKTYPVTIELKNKKIFFVIDLKCPAVKKGLIDKRFLNYAMKLWKNNWPDKAWIIKNAKDNNNKIYNWMTIDDYLTYRNKITKTKKFKNNSNSILPKV